MPDAISPRRLNKVLDGNQAILMSFQQREIERFKYKVKLNLHGVELLKNIEICNVNYMWNLSELVFCLFITCFHCDIFIYFLML